MRNQASLGRWRPAVTTTTGPKDSPSVNIWHADHPRYPFCCMHQRRVWILHSLVTTDTKSVEAFYMKCQRHILVVRWLDHSKQRSCNSHVNPSPLLDLIIKRRNTFFGNAWSDRSLTQQALWTFEDKSTFTLERPSDRSWKRLQCSPVQKNRWLQDQIHSDNIPPARYIGLKAAGYLGTLNGKLHN